MKVATRFEKNMDCSGACVAPNFWGTKDIRTGPPPMACIYRVKEKYDTHIGPIGLTVGIAAIAVYVAYFLHYFMYCGQQ